ncbi:hypothetical protein [Candidatus Poriferisodalis sp.]|uniref:hypothetical protein n=1 Tax=Candidatus Poriferisodalis sp. TaxID=3101277 RepID=UPI003B027A0A
MGGFGFGPVVCSTSDGEPLRLELRSGNDDADRVGGRLDALERLHVLEPLRAWPTHLRSRSPLLSSPRHHFTDPSLAVAALRAQPERLPGRH